MSLLSASGRLDCKLPADNACNGLPSASDLPTHCYRPPSPQSGSDRTTTGRPQPHQPPTTTRRPFIIIFPTRASRTARRRPQRLPTTTRKASNLQPPQGQHRPTTTATTTSHQPQPHDDHPRPPPARPPPTTTRRPVTTTTRRPPPDHRKAGTDHHPGLPAATRAVQSWACDEINSGIHRRLPARGTSTPTRRHRSRRPALQIIDSYGEPQPRLRRGRRPRRLSPTDGRRRPGRHVHRDSRIGIGIRRMTPTATRSRSPTNWPTWASCWATTATATGSTNPYSRPDADPDSTMSNAQLAAFLDRIEIPYRPRRRRWRTHHLPARSNPAGQWRRRLARRRW